MIQFSGFETNSGSDLERIDFGNGLFSKSIFLVGMSKEVDVLFHALNRGIFADGRMVFEVWVQDCPGKVVALYDVAARMDEPYVMRNRGSHSALDIDQGHRHSSFG